jgi:hypothetical protein
MVEVVQRDQSGVSHRLIEEAVDSMIRKNKYFNTTLPVTGESSQGTIYHLTSSEFADTDPYYFD